MSSKYGGKFSGLGRGLDSIFVENTAPVGNGVTMLRITDLEPRKNQPRKVFDREALQQLADSIAAHGVIQPVAVRESTGGFYEIIAGERRWRAAKMAGLSEIPAVVLTADDQKTAELALIENIQREDLNPIEEAKAYEKLLTEYGLTQEKLSQSVGKSRSSIANSLRILELTPEALDLLANGKISVGHAKVLLGLEDRDSMDRVAQEIAENELSVRETESIVKKLNRSVTLTPPEVIDEELPALPKVDYVAELESRVSTRLGRRVKIMGKGKSKRIELYFEDNEDLEELLMKVCGKDIFNDDI
ncbi:MAG: ParB/RepB/Spo0J family partition protein [Ruminococcaceae bacterium]|nr:ParB/RepB/Spo0J family partition protein [Oscillospiraceae bacterium]